MLLQGVRVEGGCWEHRYSGAVRLGQSGGQASSWVSDTSVVCKMSAGLGASMVLAMTSGGRVGSVTEGLSYDGNAVSVAAWVNEGTTSGVSMTVSGADFGTTRCLGSEDGCVSRLAEL